MVKIPNELLKALTTEEYYIYCALRYRYIEYTFKCTITSIDLLSQQTTFYKNQTKNKKYIKEILLSLHKQKYIQLKYEGKLKNNTELKIELYNVYPADKFTALDNRYMDIRDHQELYVLYHKTLATC